MNLYPAIEAVVIGAAVVFSADQALRHLAPAAHRVLRGWLAARLGLKPPAAPTAGGGCDSGCGSCGTGCSTDAPPQSSSSGEQPLQFVRTTPAAKP